MATAGPRPDPQSGYQSFAACEEGDKLRVRASSFADHFSQARQFFQSLSVPEQNHVIAAFTFELSKVETKAVRARMLSQLANVDSTIAKRVANGLGHEDPINNAPTSSKAGTNLKPSPALSILAKAKPTLEGRMIGVLVADGSDPAFVARLKASATQIGAKLKVIAPKVEGAKASDGTTIPGDFQLAGGASVLFDAVVVAVSSQGAQQLAAINFVADEFAHPKVIGHTSAAAPLLQRANVMNDSGVVALDGASAADTFMATAAKGRIWDREPQVRPTV